MFLALIVSSAATLFHSYITREQSIGHKHTNNTICVRHFIRTPFVLCSTEKKYDKCTWEIRSLCTAVVALILQPSSLNAMPNKWWRGQRYIEKMFRHQLICIFILHHRHHKKLVAMLDSNSVYCYGGSTSLRFAKEKYYLVSLCCF